VQGTTLSLVAKWLHVALPFKVKPKSPVDAFLADEAKSFIREIIIPENNHSVGKAVVQLKFPRKAIIAMISRNDKFLTPNGATEIEPNDMLIVLTEDNETLKEVYQSLGLDMIKEEEESLT
jgi:cell volume regulation protein A